MRVVELMKRRCRRVLEWAAAVTVTVTVSLYFREYSSFFSAAAALEKMLKRRKMKKRDLGMAGRSEPLGP